jgi:hypothetical protein
MKRTIYCALMSILIGSILGTIVVNVIGIMFPDFELDYTLSILFFVALTWSVVSLFGMVSRRPS